MFQLDRSKRYVGIISVVTVIAIVLSSLYLPGVFREWGDFYTSFEYAQMYLNDDRYEELVIEYNYVQGFPPSDFAREKLQSTIEEICHKDRVVEVKGEMIPQHPGRKRYDRDRIEGMLDEYRDYERGSGSMVLYILYLDGEWNDKPNVLGLSLGRQNIVIFKQTIISVSQRSPNLDIEVVEASVLIHEFGHILGLVGIGYDSGHENEDHKHHCDESEGRCVMSYTVEIRVGQESEPPPLDFCTLCKEDIALIRTLQDGGGIEQYLTLMVVATQGSIGLIWIVVCLSKKKKDYSHYYDYYEDYEKRNP